MKFVDVELSEASLGLDARYEIVAALDEEMLGHPARGPARGCARVSDAETIVDWGLAERTATALIAGVPGRSGRDPGPTRLYGARRGRVRL